MRPVRILVVEDDPAIREGVAEALRSEDYAVLEAATGDDGLRAAEGAAYDLLLLDLILPGRDGFSILREVRKTRPAIPIIILTAHGDEKDRVRGLKMGADDYVVKPFGVDELLARVEAVLRRAPRADLDTNTIDVGRAMVDFARREIRRGDGETVSLSEKEADLLRYFAANANRPIPREELLARVWGMSAAGIETRTVDVHVAKLRERLGDDSADPETIVTVRGKGYQFNRSES